MNHHSVAIELVLDPKTSPSIRAPLARLGDVNRGNLSSGPHSTEFRPPYQGSS